MKHVICGKYGYTHSKSLNNQIATLRNCNTNLSRISARDRGRRDNIRLNKKELIYILEFLTKSKAKELQISHRKSYMSIRVNDDAPKVYSVLNVKKVNGGNVRIDETLYGASYGTYGGDENHIYVSFREKEFIQLVESAIEDIIDDTQPTNYDILILNLPTTTYIV